MVINIEINQQTIQQDTEPEILSCVYRCLVNERADIIKQ